MCLRGAGGTPYPPASLLSFEAIGGEIAVRHEPADEGDDLARALAAAGLSAPGR